jgi:hypothetical protein
MISNISGLTCGALKNAVGGFVGAKGHSQIRWFTTLDPAKNPKTTSLAASLFTAAKKGVIAFKDTKEICAVKLEAPLIGGAVYLNPEVLELAKKNNIDSSDISSDWVVQNFVAGYHGTTNGYGIMSQLVEGNLQLDKQFFFTKDPSESRTYAVGSDPAILLVEIPEDPSVSKICPLHAKHFIEEGWNAKILGVFKKGDRLSKGGLYLTAAEAAVDAFKGFLNRSKGCVV